MELFIEKFVQNLQKIRIFTFKTADFCLEERSTLSKGKVFDFPHRKIDKDFDIHPVESQFDPLFPI
jgi:hypothetical protein